MEISPCCGICLSDTLGCYLPNVFTEVPILMRESVHLFVFPSACAKESPAAKLSLFWFIGASLKQASGPPRAHTWQPWRAFLKPPCLPLGLLYRKKLDSLLAVIRLPKFMWHNKRSTLTQPLLTDVPGWALGTKSVFIKASAQGCSGAAIQHMSEVLTPSQVTSFFHEQ